MKVNARDLLVVMDMAKYIFRIHGAAGLIGWTDEIMKQAYENIFNSFKELELEVKESK